MNISQPRRRRTWRVAAVAFGTVATALLAYGGISLASAGTATTTLIQGVGSQRCLTAAADATTAATIQDCAAQRWTVTDQGEIRIGDRCLDAKGAARANGTMVITYPCHGRGNQRWAVRSDGTIRGVGSRRCLDVTAAATGAGTTVQLWQCHGGSNQQWRQTGGTGAGPSASASRPTVPSASAPTSPGSPSSPAVPSPSRSTSTGQPPQSAETVGGGSLSNPAVGPAPTSGAFGSGYVLVKNWNFGADGTIRTIADMNREFYYHDQFGTIGNGTNYGAVTMSPDQANALSGQPVEDPNNKVRQFTPGSLKTTLVPLNGASTVSATQHNVGNGSFMARWAPATGGSRLGHDILWETRVRYVTPKYFWFALWNAGNKWDKGAEFDVVESFGYDNGGGNTNYNGRYWHADPVGGTSTTDYANWGNGMTKRGFSTFDATQYHTWSLLYRTNDSYSFYLDGVEVQSGTMHWTLGGGSAGQAIDFHFLFDAGWGHTQVGSVNKSMPASELAGKYYEFDYSRVYQR